jgi:hypothetical protein
MYKIIIVVFLAFLSRNIISQTSSVYLTQTRLIIQSEDKKGKVFNAYADFAYMILNLSTGDFTLNADLINIKTGKKHLDSLIYAQGQQPFVFKGNINGNLYLFNRLVNDEKEYNMEGQLSINKNTINCIAQYDPVNFGEKTEVKNYRMDFKLVMDASKITILGLENKINKQVVFEIMGGTLNTQP